VTLEEEAKRGTMARTLLEHELFIETFSVLERRYYDIWRETDAADTEQRERLFRLSTALADVRGHIEKVAQDGDLATRQIEDLHGRRPRMFGPSR